VDQRRRLQGVTGPLARHLLRREGPQFGINEFQQVGHGLVIPGFDLGEQARHVTG